MIDESRAALCAEGAVPMLLLSLTFADVHLVAAAMRALAALTLDGIYFIPAYVFVCFSCVVCDDVCAEPARQQVMEESGASQIAKLLSRGKQQQWEQAETIIDVRRRNAAAEKASKRIIAVPMPLEPSSPGDTGPVPSPVSLQRGKAMTGVAVTPPAVAPSTPPAEVNNMVLLRW